MKESEYEDLHYQDSGILEEFKGLSAVAIQEKCKNYEAAYASVEKACNPKVSIIANTNMDKAIRKAKEMDAFGKNDLTMFQDDIPPKEESLYLFETDKILEEELQGVANGY